MARSSVPKFGNWESEENVPYTAYFDKARKVRTSGGKAINPNDPEESSDLYSQAPPLARPKSQQEEETVKRSRERMRSREDSKLEQFAESPARRGGGNSNEANNRRQGRTTSAGSENNSYERSPLHNQARTPGRTVGAPASPLWDGSKNSYDGTARSKPRSNVKGDESPEKGTVVPKFGDWDENNPSSADGYTHIFNKVREERNSAGTGTGSSRTPSHPSSKPPADSAAKCCCFSWGGK